MNLPKLDLNITNRCNFRCAHCAFDSGCAVMPELTRGKIRQILEDTKILGGRKVDITGGEPTIRSDYIQVIESAKSLGYSVELVTNSSLLTGTDLRTLKESGLDSIAVSLDGSTYAKYSQVRKVSRGVYEKVVNTINDSVSIGLATKINTIVHAGNIDDIANITQQAIDFGAVEHGIYYFTEVGRGASQELRSANAARWLACIREKLAAYSDRIKLTVEVPAVERVVAERLGSRILCVAAAEQNHLQILPDGNVYPCAILASYGLSVGNLHEQQMTNIWQNIPLWERYWESINPSFTRGSCIGALLPEGYVPVCPLRKFSVDELRG